MNPSTPSLEGMQCTCTLIHKTHIHVLVKDKAAQHNTKAQDTLMLFFSKKSEAALGGILTHVFQAECFITEPLIKAALLAGFKSPMHVHVSKPGQ